MATVKGVWVFNETITKIPVSENVNFSVTFSDGSIGNYDRMFISGNNLGYKKAGQFGVASAYYHSISPNRWANEIWRTVDFGTTSQTVSDEFYTWLTANAVQQNSGPSEPETDILYTVYGSSLTAVANAIRGKTGTTDELAFPDGFVSTVNDISSVSDLSNAKDIAFGGNESGGKYVIEDETITPLFNQVKRITETEDAVTFEGATESLLNIVVGGDLPNAEEAFFGGDGGTEYGILTDVTPTKSQSSYRSLGYQFTVKEAIALYGFRLCGRSYQQNVMCLWDVETETEIVTLTKATEKENEWVDYNLSTPINLEVGKEYIVSNFASHHTSTTSELTYNEKIASVKHLYASEVGKNGFPNTSNNYKNGIDIIIGDQTTESVVTEYKVQVETMHDIADEIRRIGGLSGSITTSQILTVLQSIQLQDKSVIPTAEVQTVTPDDGYFALSSVTVGAITEENEAVTEIVNEKMEVVANDTY